jgi:hypothetical protein
MGNKNYIGFHTAMGGIQTFEREKHFAEVVSTFYC